jgi:ketosteroid isomerase-like protein
MRRDGSGGAGMSNIGTTLRKLCAAFNAHDLDKIMPFFADDCILELPRGREPWGTRYEGKEDVRKGLATRFEGLPDVHYGNEQHFVDEEKNTGMSKWLLTGTTPKGVQVKVQGCDFYTFRADGKVIRKDSYWKIIE